MRKNEKLDSAIGGAVISGSFALMGLSAVFGSVAMSPLAVIGTVFTIAACGAVCAYSVGVALEASRIPPSDKSVPEREEAEDRRPPSPPV